MYLDKSLGGQMRVFLPLETSKIPSFDGIVPHWGRTIIYVVQYDIVQTFVISPIG